MNLKTQERKHLPSRFGLFLISHVWEKGETQGTLKVAPNLPMEYEFPTHLTVTLHCISVLLLERLGSLYPASHASCTMPALDPAQHFLTTLSIARLSKLPFL